MDLDAFMTNLKAKYIEESALLIQKKELSKAFNGDTIPTLNEYSTMTVQLLKLLIDDKKYYKYMYKKLIENDAASLVFNAIAENDKKEEYRFKKIEIVNAMEWAKKNRLLTQGEKEKLKLLKMSVEFKKFIEKYKEENTCTIIEGKFITIPVNYFIDLMTMNSSNLNKIVKKEKYKNKKLDYVVYALDEFLSSQKVMYKYRIPKKVDRNILKLKKNVDILYINKCLTYKATYLNDVKINDELRQELLKDIPENFDKLEKSFYIYYKMCYLLTYDDRYFAKRNINEKGIHRSLHILPTINQNNQEIICYEFNSLYAKMLKEINIIYELNGNSEYSNGHASLTLRADKYLVNVDSTIGMFNSDLANAKNGLLLKGFRLENTNLKTKKEFEKKIDKVYKYIGNNKSFFNKYYGTVRDLNIIQQNIPNNLSFNEKVLHFISLANSSNLKQMDKIPYEIGLCKIIFDEENKEKTKFQINYVSYEPTDDINLHRTAKILTFNDKGINDIKNNKYIFIDNHNRFYKLNLHEIKHHLYTGKIRGLYKNNRTIPGVKLDEMNGLGDTKKYYDISAYKPLKKDNARKVLDKLYRVYDYNNSESETNKAHKKL